MASTYYTISIRSAGVRQTGLTPTWAFFKKLSDKTDIGSPPAIDEVSGGVYRFSYDPAMNEAVGQIDGGSSITAEGDRYIDVLLTQDTSGNISINLNQTVPASDLSSKTTQTLGDCLSAARADGAGKWVFSGTTFTLYGPDGTQIIRQFTLNDATDPTQRS